MSFESYTNCILRSFELHPKATEIIKRKYEILTSISHFYNFTANSVLYVGFNPAILSDTSKEIFVTHISKQGLNFLHSQGKKVNYIQFNELSKHKFDVVIALDEFFTFAKTDIEQKDLVTMLSKITREYLITTCKDYKNQEYKDREFSIPSIVRNDQSKLINLEFHDHDLTDRNSWVTEVFEIKNNQLNTVGPFFRRALFFKQLAKFTADCGAVNFTVHKNLMYKSLIKKNYEHVISVQFENNES